MTAKILAWIALILLLFDLFKLTNKIEKLTEKALKSLKLSLHDEDSQLTILIYTLSVIITIPIAIIVPIVSMAISDHFFNHGIGIIFTLQMINLYEHFHISVFRFLIIVGKTVFSSLGIKLLWPTLLIIIFEIRGFRDGVSGLFEFLVLILKAFLYLIYYTFHFLSTYVKGLIWNIGFIIATITLLHEYDIVEKIYHLFK